MFTGDTESHNPDLQSCKAPEEKPQNAKLPITVTAVQVDATCRCINQAVVRGPHSKHREGLYNKTLQAGTSWLAC